MEDRYIGKLANGMKIYDRENSHWQTAHKDVSRELLVEALGKIDISEEEKKQDVIIKEIDMGRVIGKTNCVTVTNDDETFMARRHGRECLTHIVVGRESSDFNKIVVILEKNGDTFNLLTTYIGENAPMEPGDPALLEKNNEEMIEEARQFWMTHALLYNRDVIEYVYSHDGKKMSTDEFEREYVKESKQYGFDIPDDALIMLIGIAASGKSSIAKSIAKRYDSKIIVSDDIREEIFADEIAKGEKDKLYSTEAKTKVYDELISQVEENMKEGTRTIADATFLYEVGEKAREKLYEITQKYDRPLRVIIMKTSKELANEMDKYRDKKVGSEVIEKMFNYMESSYENIIDEIEKLPNVKYKIVDTQEILQENNGKSIETKE